MTEFHERSIRIQIKDQIDRMKFKKQSGDYEYSGSDEEGSSLDPPTIRKQKEGDTHLTVLLLLYLLSNSLSLPELVGSGGRDSGGALSPSKSGVSIGEDEEEEEEDELTEHATLVTPRSGQRDQDFSEQDTLIIREGQPGVSLKCLPLLHNQFLSTHFNINELPYDWLIMQA